METVLNSIDNCTPQNLYDNYGKWIKVGQELICSPTSDSNYSGACSLGYALNYSVNINKNFTIEVAVGTEKRGAAALREGTVFSEKICKERVRKEIFTVASLEWLEAFADVNLGEIKFEDKDSMHNRVCYKNFFQASYYPESGRIGSYSFIKSYVPCY